jgi:(p)ppGpp synthase/HD superfamily hydrolase
VAYATAVHATQVRKGTDIPYISHVLAVAALVIEVGGTEDMAIAGLLHDAGEDQGGEARVLDIEARFGAEVGAIVRTCSDTLVADRRHKEPHAKRKADYLTALGRAPDTHITVSIADKVHNARSILTDLRAEGIETLDRFTNGGAHIPDYLGACLAIGESREGVSRKLTLALREAYEQICLLTGAPIRQ